MLKKSSGTLLMILLVAAGYILLSAVVIFQVETDMFKNFFDAVYWAAVSLTTIGYGDFYPVTDLGKFITIVSSVMGVAVVALPSGVITAGYMNEVKGMEDEMKERYKEIQDKIRKAEKESNRE